MLCIKVADFYVIEIKRIILLIFALFIKITLKKYDKMIFWHNKFSLSKSCSTWFSLKISSDGGDFRRIIEIALFRNYSTEILLFKSILHSCQLVFYFISRQRKCLRTVSSCILYWSSATRIWKNLLTESLTSHPPHTWISYSRRWKGCNISIISTLL